MKCPHCNQEHPDNFQFCPVTGMKLDLLKACTLNPDCPDHGKHILPLDSLFCPTCGFELEDSTQSSDNDGLHYLQLPCYVITDDCVACGTCLSECPVDAISEGDIYEIDADSCVQCGTCADICPCGAINYCE